MLLEAFVHDLCVQAVFIKSITIFFGFIALAVYENDSS